MASFALAGYSSLARTLNNGETGFIARTGTLYVDGGTAVTMNLGSSMVVEGTIAASSRAVNMGGTSNLIVGAQGSLSSVSNLGTAVYLSGDPGLRVIANAGTIQGAVNGIFGAYVPPAESSGFVIQNSGTISGTLNTGAHVSCSQVDSQLVNSGLIEGGKNGVVLAAYNAVTSIEVTNSGTIRGGDFGIRGSQLNDMSSAVVVNTGLIASGDAAGNFIAILLGIGADSVVNAGRIVGHVDLADGDDTYIGRFGETEGTVFGGGGNDKFAGGGAGDDFNGGAGNDLLIGRGGDDSLTGSNGADTIRGGDGDDTLNGGKGRDLVKAGRGNDEMTGGAGNDTFVLLRNSGDNTITDFSNGADVVNLAAFGLRPADFSTVVAPALSNAGGGATMLDLAALGGSGSVLIQGLAFAQADAADFLL